MSRKWLQKGFHLRSISKFTEKGKKENDEKANSKKKAIEDEKKKLEAQHAFVVPKVSNRDKKDMYLNAEEATADNSDVDDDEWAGRSRATWREDKEVQLTLTRRLTNNLIRINL